ncbi:hypothetical protein F9L07_27195 [Pimelobacter simplex]|uniref:Uncharacterized protein n=1 Tax=Nocardioides simplex TaxID=2045 RepID=A0A7J5DQY7_NOCSI|nr:hypothetical protein [Pimelobacter simplex]KAB2807179.1 hypothetical protein F9L07_27195 [Pimelobacter simplex]
MENTPEPALAALIDQLEGEEYDVSEPLPGVLHVKGRFSNPERIALRAAAEAGDHAVAVWATSHHDDWALVGWARPDLVAITQKGATPQRWRHRRLPPTLRPDAQTFLEGASSPFDIVPAPSTSPPPRPARCSTASASPTRPRRAGSRRWSRRPWSRRAWSRPPP